MARRRSGPFNSGRSFSGLLVALASFMAVACGSGKKWVNAPFRENTKATGVRLMEGPPSKAEAKDRPQPTQPQASINAGPGPLSDAEFADARGTRPALKLKGRRPTRKGPVDGTLLGVFRNTYYDFPAESDFDGPSTKIMDRSCKPLKEVPRGFHDAVCVQGSGTLINGTTISFAKRDCACARICPRTDQKICFDALDQKEFPWGRGARGTAITPLRTIAVDSAVIPLGTKVYILEYDGIERTPGGARHDGCFVAEDRGMKVVGEHVDIFSGNPRTTAHLNELVPSNAGVHVYEGTARCASLEL